MEFPSEELKSKVVGKLLDLDKKWVYMQGTVYSTIPWMTDIPDYLLSKFKEY